MCVFRDGKNFERFSYFTQGIVHLAIIELKDLHRQLSKASGNDQEVKLEDNKEGGGKKKDKENGEDKKKEKSDENDGTIRTTDKTKETWDLQEKEKLLNFLSKLFLMNFPLYQVRCRNLSCSPKR